MHAIRAARRQTAILFPFIEGRHPLARIGLVMAMVGACTGGEADFDAAFEAVLDEAWQFELREDPFYATNVGDHRFDDRLPAVTLEDHARRADARRQALARLSAIDPDSLDEQNRITYAILEQDLRDRIGEYEFNGHLIPFTSDDGFHIEFARLPSSMPFRTTDDYGRYIARLRAWPEFVRQSISLLQEGLRTGTTMPRIVLEGYDVTMASHVVSSPEQSVFWAPFATFPSTIPEADRQRLRQEGRLAVEAAVVPGYRALLEFFTNEYIPAARTTTGASDLPNGNLFYEHRVRMYTTLDLTPVEIHDLGQREVERIRNEMEGIMREVGFGGDFAAFLAFLRNDARFYARTPDQLLKEAAWIAKRMDGALPSLFGRLPRLPYGVQPVPAHLAPKYTGGRYISAPPGGRQPGYYWINTYALDSRPLYTLEALTLHEAVPGHHLQISLAQELDGLPALRRNVYHSAFGEGWGLYAERLGLEAGFYRDPYSNFGRLTYEMWRACRLVVDTGIHALGWTRQQALDFLAQNTALSLHEVTTETDRYISWPGQALAYKMGELHIRDLRARAESQLGERFDLRSFHDAVLANGSVPLDVLTGMIEQWIESVENRP
jgi:uncharacterized protein (DUF885 family)